MYMADIKNFAKNESELETLLQNIRLNSQDIGMEFRIKKNHHVNNTKINKIKQRKE